MIRSKGVRRSLLRLRFVYLRDVRYFKYGLWVNFCGRAKVKTTIELAVAMRGLRGRKLEPAPNDIADKWIEEALTHNYWRLVGERWMNEEMRAASGSTLAYDQEDLSVNAV